MKQVKNLLTFSKFMTFSSGLKSFNNATFSFCQC